MISEHKELAREIAQLERKLADHDDQIIAIIQAIKELSGPQPVPEKRRIGFHSNYIDSSHGSALSVAILQGHLEVLDFLIENGVNVNAEYHDGIGPLEVALRNPKSQVVCRLVCAGAKLRKKTRPYYRERLEQCLAEVSAANKM